MQFTTTVPATIDLAIIGAGPHALTLTTHLLQKMLAGPTARNLSGARMACEKIVPAIVKPSVAFSHRLNEVQAG